MYKLAEYLCFFIGLITINYVQIRLYINLDYTLDYD
jgi:hypothetical protein